MQNGLVPSVVRCEGFYARGLGGARSRPRLERAMRSELGSVTMRALGDGWLVTTKRDVAPGLAWAHARAIRDQLGGAADVAVEPLFAVTARPPAKKSGGGDPPPLPCAANNTTWSLDVTRTQRAWTLDPPAGGKRLGEGIRVAHPDTGYTAHPELVSVAPARSRVRSDLGRDFEDGRADPLDPLDGSNAHGTATGSVIMSDAGGGKPFVAGIAPAAELVPLRVSDGVVHFSFKNVVQAIHHAIDTAKADLVSMSLGGPFPSGALEDAVARATGEGMVVLAAAGNVWPWVVYPARLPQVVAVAAANCHDQPWSESASGDAVDITAPGESVWRAWTADTGQKYRIGPSSGTSYATATVAGACALWLAFHGRARLVAAAGGQAGIGALFRSCLRASARVPNGWDTANYGAGLLDVLDLLGAPLAKSKSAKKLAAKKTPVEPADLVASFFDPQDRGRAVARVEARLGKTAAERRRKLDRLGAELVFQIATDPELHRSLAAPSRKGKAAAAAPRVPRGSPELRQALGL